MNITYYPIDEQLAKSARAMWSFTDYKDGSTTAEYKAAVDECYKLIDKVAQEYQEKAVEIADRYAKKLADWYNRKHSIDMMCPSMMISGGSNFPVNKKERQNAASDKHYQLYKEIAEIPNKIKKLGFDSGVIMSGDENATEKLTAKLEKLQHKQTQMKAVNAYYRKNGTCTGFEGLDDKDAQELDNDVKNGYSWEKQPFPSYHLTNQSAEIRRIKARINEIEKIKSNAESPKEYNTDLFKVVENAEIMRLQLIFDGKPSEEIRTSLKARGFKWAPSQGAWQRQLTENAKYSLKMLIQEIS